MAQGTWGEYLQLLNKVAKTLEELTGVEQTKTRAVMAGNLPDVEQCMKREQVISLSLRGLDKKREAMLDQLGIKGVPLRNIMDHCPEGAEKETRETADNLRRHYAVFQAASEVARNTLECNLHAIEQIQARMNGGGPVPEAPPAHSDFRA